jgi:hypothetical protein
VAGGFEGDEDSGKFFDVNIPTRIATLYFSGTSAFLASPFSNLDTIVSFEDDKWLGQQGKVRVKQMRRSLIPLLGSVP